MKTWQRGLAVALCMSLPCVIAHGESYPSRTITLVVTAAPGGVTDILAREQAARSADRRLMFRSSVSRCEQ